MRKLLFALPVVLLLAAGCNSAQQASVQTPSTQTSAGATNAASPGAPASAGTGTSASISGQLKTVDAPPPTTAYVAANDGFTVNFPNAPEVTNSTYKSPTAGSIPVTEYRQQFSAASENAYYTVYVYHYPPSYQFASDYLSTALQSYEKVVNASFSGSVIASQQSTQFAGSAAVSGLITIPLKSGLVGSASTVNTGDYVLVTTHNHDLYIISTYGVTQSNYNAFVNSFKFN